MTDSNSPFKRVYFDITHEEHEAMKQRAREAGMTQRAYLAHLIANDKGGKRPAKSK